MRIDDSDTYECVESEFPIATPAAAAGEAPELFKSLKSVDF